MYVYIDIRYSGMGWDGMGLLIRVVYAKGDERVHFSRSEVRETVCDGDGGRGVVRGKHHHHLTQARKLPPYGHGTMPCKHTAQRPNNFLQL